jgi:hypothetical protein
MANIIAVVKRNNLSQSDNPPIVLKNNISAISQNYIHNLLDVVETNPQTGDTLVYNSVTNKYEVKPVNVSAADIDGGTF